jgi:predicted short-subunit dehydrogenase-like oxidoreductase (DUF2520 family)
LKTEAGLKAKGRKSKNEKGRGEGRANGPVSPSARAPRADAERLSRDGRASAPKPTVGVLGAGRLGTALALALTSRGYEVEFLVTREARQARRAARLTGVDTARAFSVARLGELPRVDLLLITTPDDSIEEMAARLAAIEGAGRVDTRAAAHTRDTRDGPRASSAGSKPRVVLHTSGALSSDVLAPLRAVGYAVGSMHPLAAVSEARAGAESLGRAFFCVEGDPRAARCARQVVRELGARSFSVPTSRKALYHAAAVMSAGHAVALFDVAAGLLARCGLRHSEARAVLLPLLRSALDNLSKQEPARALTGTYARADIETVRRHLAALRAVEDEEAREIYLLLGRRSLRLAAAGGADPQALAEIARLLSKVESPPRAKKKRP